MSISVLHANGIRFDRVRPIEFQTTDALDFFERMKIANRNFAWHRRLGQIVFYSCISVVVIYLLYSIAFNHPISETWILPFLFCNLVPAIVGVVQELLFGFKFWVKVILILPLSYIGFGMLFPTHFISENIVAGIVFIYFFVGWIMILFRWFDAKHLLPLVSQGISDFNAGTVYAFVESDDEGNEIQLEVLPNSQLIYKFQENTLKKWESADFAEVTDPADSRYLAPWYFAPKESKSADVKYYQRKLTNPEVRELESIRRRFLRKYWLSSLLSVYFSALGVRLIENMISWEIESQLSLNGWVVSIIIGLTIPIKFLLKWIATGKDIKIQIVVSVWSTGASESEDKLLEEFLQESKLIWSQSNCPSAWRLVSKF